MPLSLGKPRGRRESSVGRAAQMINFVAVAEVHPEGKRPPCTDHRQGVFNSAVESPHLSRSSNVAQQARHYRRLRPPD